MSTNRLIAVSSFITLALAWLGAAIVAQPDPKPAAAEVIRMKLPLDLPAIGNIPAVKTWRFGRIESVVQTGGSGDVKINIRIEDGSVLEVVGPRVLGDLARASNWTSQDSGNPRVMRADYVERMVAFDVDADKRIIAMISMEPMDRDRSRLQRGM